MFVYAAGAGRTRLRPHEGQQDVLASIVFDSLDDHYEPGVSNCEDVYRFFLAEVKADAADVCDALYRLEHVLITLAPSADAQQVFESVNSTGAPLRDHELVHNYVLMGLTYGQQIEIEREYCRPIEANTGEFIDQFFRDYLTHLEGRPDGTIEFIAGESENGNPVGSNGDDDEAPGQLGLVGIVRHRTNSVPPRAKRPRRR